METRILLRCPNKVSNEKNSERLYCRLFVLIDLNFRDFASIFLLVAVPTLGSLVMAPVDERRVPLVDSGEVVGVAGPLRREVHERPCRKRR